MNETPNASLVYDLGGARIYQGHAPDILPLLPEQSIQTCITSPPYWNLRAYGTNPQVWGGSADCDHDWLARRWYSHSGGQASQSSEAFSAPGETNAERIKAARWHEDGLCTKCSAWLGELGGEPTPELYVANLVTVFRGVWRVLRDDATLWLNLGDSYSGSGKGPGNNGLGASTIGRAASQQETRQGFVNRLTKVDGLKSKNLVGIPWMVAFALQADGWCLRRDIIWDKPNPMPESVDDRPTTSHEYLFLLSKQPRYYYDAEAIKEPGAEPERERADRIGGTNGHTVRHSPGAIVGATATRNKRSVWRINTESYAVEMCMACKAIFEGAGKKAIKPRMINGELVRICPKCKTTDKWLGHFATFPKKLVEPCILAGSKPGDTVLDPFTGSGTTLYMARHHGRRAVGIELNPDYALLAIDRLKQGVLPL